MARADSVSTAWAEARELLALLPRLVGSRVHLFALELRRAGGALGLMVALAVAAALMIATAGLALWASAAAALIELGLGWGWSVLIVAVVNVGGAALLLLKMRSLGRLLTLPATVRRLGVVSAAAAAARGAPAPHQTRAAESAPMPANPPTRR